MSLRITVLFILASMMLAGPVPAEDDGRRSGRSRDGDSRVHDRDGRRHDEDRGERSFRRRSADRERSAREQRAFRAWRDPDTSFEINRRLSPGGDSRAERRHDGHDDRRRFKELEHDRPELTGRRNVIRVWTRDLGREIDRRDRDHDHDRRDRRPFGRRHSDRRDFHLVQRRHGPISPSEWEAHRQSRIDARRGESSDWSHDRAPSDFRRDRFDDPIGRAFERHVPESAHFDHRPVSPIGPTKIGPGYIIQYDTRAHVHHEGCGHYFYEDRWHQFPKDHVHHEGCGHFFYDNTWHRFPRGHYHYPGCGHYFYDYQWWDFPRRHKHGPHCGHFRYDGIWHRFPKTHRHGPDCGHYYYDGYWHIFPRTHRHHPGCGHYYFNYFWYPFAPSHYGYEVSDGVYGGETDYESPLVESYEDPARRHAARAYDRCRRGDYYGAIAAFSTAIATAPDNGPLYLAQGLAYMRVGDIRSAYSKIREGLRRLPDMASGHPDLRGIIPDPEFIEWQIDELIWMIEDNPDNHRALFVLGYLHFLRGDYEYAKPALQDVAALDSGNESARRLLDYIYQVEAEETS